jgi:hypothetical protein
MMTRAEGNREEQPALLVDLPAVIRPKEQNRAPVLAAVIFPRSGHNSCLVVMNGRRRTTVAHADASATTSACRRDDSSWMNRLQEMIDTHSPDNMCMQLRVSEPFALNTGIPHMCRHSIHIQ